MRGRAAGGREPGRIDNLVREREENRRRYPARRLERATAVSDANSPAA